MGKGKVGRGEGVGGYFEMLYAEQWGLDLNLLYSLATR